ncbi:MAG: bifunctional aspartate kinase/diaminopimelate decarboxylase [Xanthomonadales bacterium]|nr:bifunctional aspartate kinase/diaminopimelate decarboxylase [Xanthomonadales bacterium]
MEPRWVVMKFGGTSVATGEKWRLIHRTVTQRITEGYHVLLVVSAIRGVTDQLQAFIDGVSQADSTYAAVRACYVRLWSDLERSATEAEVAEFARLENLLGGDAEKQALPAHQAEILGMGEYLSSRTGQAVLAETGLETAWVDAKDLLRCVGEGAGGTRADYLSARVDHAPVADLPASLADRGRVLITQGFVASNHRGEAVVLGRGGSDTSATCMGAVLGAERVEIWSDVPGLFSANPHQIPGARLLRHVSYREAQELSSMGARVLHPRCIEPVRDHLIPLHLFQTDKPELAGTIISAQARDYAAQVKAIVHRKRITLIVMEGLRMWQTAGFLADAFAVFKRHRLSVDLISTSESNVTVSLDLDEQLLEESVLEAVREELADLCRVSIIHHCASVSLVGLGIRTILHRLGPALEVFEERRIFLVSQAANDLNLTFVVEERHAEKLVQQLHQTLIPGGVGGDSVFGPTWEQLHFDRVPGRDRPDPWWRLRSEELLALLGEREAAYVYDTAIVAAAADRLSRIEQIDAVFYAVKANAHPAVLRTVADRGLGFECVSLAEVDHVLATLPAIAPRRILCTPNFATRGEYRALLQRGVHLTLDNLYILENWAEELAGSEVFIRVDPGSGLGHHKLVRTAGTHSKFGMPPRDLERAAELAEAHDIRIVGLHAHTGSGVMHPDAWERTLRVLGEWLPRFPDVRHVDVGGGLGVPDKQDDLPLDLDALGRGLARVRDELPEGVEIWIEPGRYLVAESGVLLLRVTQLKGKGDVRYVGVASGMNSLIRPALYGAYHEIQNLSRLDADASGVYNVVGPICETSDVLGLDRVLPECRENDILVVANAGAYGAVMASAYNRRMPAEELVLEKAPPDG